MAILLLENKLFHEHPGLISRIIEKIHPVAIGDAWPPVLHMTRLTFDHKDFLDNEVVMIQIYKKYNKLIPTMIRATDKPFIRIYRHRNKLQAL